MLLAALTLLALAQGATPSPAALAPASPDAEALGAARCVDCHEAIVASYARSGMARALGPIAPGELAGLAEVAAGDTGYRYQLVESGSGERARAWITETWRAPGDEDELATSAPLDFAVGAGIADRSFVARRDGHWSFAPLERLSATDTAPRRAVLAPGHMAVPLLRFANPIAEECLACHTDRLPPRQYPRDLVPPASAAWTPRGIGCATCHGDVDAHADWREHELAGETPEGDDPVLHLDALSLEQRVSVCARCHLQGDARLALRPGERGIPPPGGDLLERWAIFLPPGDDGEIAFVSQVERMVASRCYVASLEEGRAPLSCETCHDPHRSLSDPRAREQVRGACLKCHASSPREDRSGCTLPRTERGGRDCVDCHMRTTGVFDVANVAIHDHLVARAPAPARRTGSIRIHHTQDGALAVFGWPGRPRPGYAEDPGLALMAAVVSGFPARAVPLVDREPADSVKALATYQHLRAIVLEGLGRPDDAAKAYREALRLEPDSPDSAVNLAPLLARAGKTTEGLRLLDDVLARHPSADNALRNRALLKLSGGDTAGFAADLEAAYRLRPEAALARALASYFTQRGDRKRARELTDQARRLAPHESTGR